MASSSSGSDSSSAPPALLAGLSVKLSAGESRADPDPDPDRDPPLAPKRSTRGLSSSLCTTPGAFTAASCELYAAAAVARVAKLDELSLGLAGEVASSQAASAGSCSAAAIGAAGRGEAAARSGAVALPQCCCQRWRCSCSTSTKTSAPSRSCHTKGTLNTLPCEHEEVETSLHCVLITQSHTIIYRHSHAGLDIIAPGPMPKEQTQKRQYKQQNK
jgi:hypothetical protein